MNRAANGPGVSHEFDMFLRAPIAQGGDGLFFSVLSGLARLDIDPWLEAEELAMLPLSTATQRLSALISTLSDGRPAPLDPSIKAASLIALLPHRPHATTKSRAISHSISVTEPHASLSWIAFVIFLIISLTAQYFITHSAAKPPAAQAPVAAPKR
jgi:hypothetical protein